MLDEYLVQECKLVTPTRSAYSDYIDTGVYTTLACRFRFIPTMRRETNSEVNDSDAMVWFEADSGIAVGNIVLFEQVYYQIERLTKARRLGEEEVQFIKCDVKVTNIGIS